MASSDALQKIRVARKWRAEFYKRIVRQNDLPCEMYTLAYEDEPEQYITIGIDDGPVPTKDIAQLIVDRLNKEDKA